MSVVVFDRDVIKSEVVTFLEVDENWDNVVKLFGWEHNEFYANDLYNVLTDLYIEGIKGAYMFVEEGQEVEYPTIEKYISDWMDGDF